MFIRGFYESSEWTGASFALLDTILGEYNAEVYVSWINKKPLIADVDLDDLIPITELYENLQAHISQVNN